VNCGGLCDEYIVGFPNRSGLKILNVILNQICELSDYEHLLCIFLIMFLKITEEQSA